MFRTWIGRGLLAASIAAAALVSAAPRDAKFTVGVLRRDGLLIPFAAYAGGRWTVPWPAAGANVPLPISLADVPKSWWGDVAPTAPWTAWLADDQKRPLKLLKPEHVPIFCAAHLAIATDYRGAPPSEREPTMGKDGIATAGEVEILPIVQVSINSPDAGLLLKAIAEKFNDEEELAASNFTHWRHPYSPGMRERIPLQLESFYRASENGRTGPFRTSYVEVVRRYPALAGDEGCGLVSFARGWVTEFDGTKKPIINLGVRITYCDRNEVSFMQPFGRVRLEGSGGRGSAAGVNAYWIYQLSSWREEFYSVAQVGPDGVRPVVVVAGGACPKEPPR